MNRYCAQPLRSRTVRSTGLCKQEDPVHASLCAFGFWARNEPGCHRIGTCEFTPRIECVLPHPSFFGPAVYAVRQPNQLSVCCGNAECEPHESHNPPRGRDGSRAMLQTLGWACSVHARDPSVQRLSVSRPLKHGSSASVTYVSLSGWGGYLFLRHRFSLRGLNVATDRVALGDQRPSDSCWLTPEIHSAVGQGGFPC